MLALAAICALVGWVFAFAVTITTTRDKALLTTAHERQLDREHQRIDSLVSQVQNNSQGMYSAPSFTQWPEPQVDNERVLYDDTGLIEVRVPADDFADREI